ncbi:MAG: Rab family GTPase [Candidatus Thorarchaeota archaeon]
MKYDYVFKLLLLGEPAVGKTSLIIRYVKDSFKSDYMSTIGANFLVKEITLPSGASVMLQIWDIAGQSLDARYAQSYYSGASGALLVFDVTRPETLNRLTDWHSDVQKQAPKDLLGIVVGNKNDLDAAVADSDMEAMTKKINALRSFSTSAKDGTGVNDAFQSLAKLLAEQADKKRES